MNTLRQSLLGALGAGRERVTGYFFVLFFFLTLTLRWQREINEAKSAQFKVKSTAAAAAAGRQTFLCAVKPAVDSLLLAQG
jgi:preprotein translocase subunit SecG